MILERLKTETRDAHDRLEALADSDRIMDGTLTAAGYRRLILSNYVLHRALEPLLADAISRHDLSVLHFEERIKLPLLERDMQELGLAAPDIPFAASVHLDTPAQVLGCMYVLEGSTLGGSVIRRKLAAGPLGAGTPFHFYGCYGERTGPMWTSFRAAVTAIVRTPEQEEETLQAAVQTFETAAQCFSLDIALPSSADSGLEHR